MTAPADATVSAMPAAHALSAGSVSQGISRDVLDQYDGAMMMLSMLMLRPLEQMESALVSMHLFCPSDSLQML